MNKTKRTGNRLRVLRAEHRVSQQQVADALEYSASYVSLLENDRLEPPATVLAKLSAFFGCKPSDIFPSRAA